jgi:hypothetical protein
MTFYSSYAGFEVLTVEVMNSSIFWDIKLCSLLKVNQNLRGTCHLYLQGWRVSQARNQHEAGSKLQPWRLHSDDRALICHANRKPLAILSAVKIITLTLRQHFNCNRGCIKKELEVGILILKCIRGQGSVFSDKMYLEMTMSDNIYVDSVIYIWTYAVKCKFAQLTL